MIFRNLLLTLLITTTTSASSLLPLKIIAHRGASAYAPENTLAAFKLALEMGVDGVELDIHASADSKLMVIHDSHTGRTGNKHLSISETHSQELRNIDVGHWKGDAWKGETIPFLEEVLELVPKNKHLFIECKLKDPTIFLNALNQLWENYEERLSSSTFISFHAPILLALKQEKPHLTTLLLIEEPQILATYTHLVSSEEHLPFSGVGIDEALPIDENWAQSVKSHTQILSVWTVNNPQTALNYHAWGFHYLTTDKPDLLSNSSFSAQ